MAPAFAAFCKKHTKKQSFRTASDKRSLLGVGLHGIEDTRLLYDLEKNVENEKGERRGI